MKKEGGYQIAIIGGGSWATAIAKILQSNNISFSWYMRSKPNIDEFKKLGHNPRYLSSVQFNLDKITFYSDINECAKAVDVMIFAIPSAFLEEGLKKLHSINNKSIVSAIKGIVPNKNQVVSEFFVEKYGISYNNFCVIKGPCHAEEIALERLSYLTVASKNKEYASWFGKCMHTYYTKVNIGNDVIGAEYATVLKNIMAIASGIAYGLRYGDNFQAALISNAIQEIKHFLDILYPAEERNVMESLYLGDLLVTTYSQFSRNRTFGTMLGRGYTVKSAILELSMVAEGYYAVKGIYKLVMKHNINMPITKAVYNILYEKISPSIEMKLLSEQMK